MSSKSKNQRDGTFEQTVRNLVCDFEYAVQVRGWSTDLAVNLYSAIRAALASRPPPPAAAEASPDVRCLFCGDPAIGVYWLPEGCACRKDTMQALCDQHVGKCSPVGRMELIRDLRVGASPAGETLAEAIQLFRKIKHRCSSPNEEYPCSSEQDDLDQLASMLSALASQPTPPPAEEQWRNEKRFLHLLGQRVQVMGTASWRLSGEMKSLFLTHWRPLPASPPAEAKR